MKKEVLIFLLLLTALTNLFAQDFILPGSPINIGPGVKTIDILKINQATTWQDYNIFVSHPNVLTTSISYFDDVARIEFEFQCDMLNGRCTFFPNAQFSLYISHKSTGVSQPYYPQIIPPFYIDQDVSFVCNNTIEGATGNRARFKISGGSAPYTLDDGTEIEEAEYTTTDIFSTTNNIYIKPANESGYYEMNLIGYSLDFTVQGETAKATTVEKCDGTAHRAIHTGYGGNLKYTWFDEDMNSIGQETETAVGLCPGKYLVQCVHEPTGCYSTPFVRVPHLQNALVCPGGSYTFPNGVVKTNINSEWYQTSYLTTQDGYDSTIYTTLTVAPVYNEVKTARICAGENYNFGSQTLTISGSYTELFESVTGCDSTVVLTLTVDEVSTAVTVDGITLTANEADANFQWFNCNSGNSLIALETNQSFTPPSNGLYGVQITKNGCVVESECYSIIVTSADEKQNVFKGSVTPNPTEGVINLDLGSLHEEVTVVLRSIQGMIISNKVYKNAKDISYRIDGASGLYHLTVRSKSKDLFTYKVIKN